MERFSPQAYSFGKAAFCRKWLENSAEMPFGLIGFACLFVYHGIMLLYVHVPFCRAKCGYCAFHSLPLQASAAAPAAPRAGRGDLAQYLAGLEIELRNRAPLAAGQRIESVFFGGGTPSLLPPRALARVMECIRAGYDLAPDAEISLEANPESVPDVMGVREWVAAGVNRISLGVQSFSDERLAALRRLHNAAEAMSAFWRLRDGGFRNLSLDLMWGLPGQRSRTWMDELKIAVELGPDHLSCYGLTLEPGTPLADAYIGRMGEGTDFSADFPDDSSGDVFGGSPGDISDGSADLAALRPKALPGEAEQSRMYVYGMEYLASQGYMQYEISNLARMGFNCRHNGGYWNGADYLGFGPAATSTVRGVRWTNSTDHARWRRDTAVAVPAEDGTWGDRLERIDAKTRLLETVMLRLRTTKGLPYELYRDLTGGRSLLRDHGILLRGLSARGLMSLRNRHARLTLTGMLVSNSILENLFERIDTVWGEHCAAY